MDKSSTSEKVIRRLYQITNSYQKGLTVQIEELLRMGLERFNLDVAILSRIDGNNYTVMNCICPEGTALQVGDQFEIESTYCHITCEVNGPIAVEHVGQHAELKMHPAYQRFKLEAYLAIPIRCNGALYGTLNFSSARPYQRKFDEFDIDVLQLMASWLEVELIRHHQQQQLKILNEKLEILALNDPLTNLPNRRSLFKTVPKSLKRLHYDHQQGAVAMVDIDFFKQVNDDHGHQFGDVTLCQVATKIQAALRESDFVGRFGGEEFVIWLPTASPNACRKICDRIMSSVAEVVIDDKPVTVSIGVCYFIFRDVQIRSSKQLFDDFISTADKALYEAKNSGRNRMILFEHVFASNRERNGRAIT